MFDSDSFEYTDYSYIEKALNYDHIDAFQLDRCNGNFYYHNIMKTPISIKITDDFDNSDFIGIPINSFQSEEIKKYSTVKKSHDFKVYQVKSNKIAIYHESDYMNQIIEKIKVGLGIEKDEQIDYLFSKMIISTNQACNNEEKRKYEQLNIGGGGNEKINKDEDEDREDEDDEDEEDSDYSSKDHISTVILTLPSRHKGGSILVKDSNSREEFNYKSDKIFESAQEFHYLAFYSDCTFNIDSVSEGNHIYLVFKLYKTSSNKYSAKQLHQLKTSPSFILYTQIKKILENQSSLIYVLNQEYKTLSFNSLGINDRIILNKLQELFKSDPEINLALGNLDITKEGDNYSFKIHSLVYICSVKNQIERMEFTENFSYFLPMGCFDIIAPNSSKKRGSSVISNFTKQVILLYNNRYSL